MKTVLMTTILLAAHELPCADFQAEENILKAMGYADYLLSHKPHAGCRNRSRPPSSDIVTRLASLLRKMLAQAARVRFFSEHAVQTARRSLRDEPCLL
jgi:hypothetical protein